MKHRCYKTAFALLFVSLIVFGFSGCASFSEKEEKQEMGEGEVTKQFLMKQMMRNGGVRTNYLDASAVPEYATGDQVLSESQGLLMRYAVEAGDAELFEQAYGFVRDHLLVDKTFISYRYSEEKGPYPANAVIDDLRIIGALISAAQVFENDAYLGQALSYAGKLYDICVIDGTLRDFYDLKGEATSETFTLCYADFKTLSLLSDYDDRWETVFENSLELVKGGYLGDAFPMFSSSYCYDTGTYSDQDIDTVSMLLTALNLAEIGECPLATRDFIKRQVLKGELLGKYSAAGMAKSDVQSTAIYAIASILGGEMKDDELQQAAILKMREFRVKDEDSPLFGAYANADTQEAYSFDNLYAILAEIIWERHM